MEENEELEALKQKKLEAMLLRAAQQRQNEEEQQAKVDAQISALMRQLLTDDARQRLNNVKLVNKDLHLKVVQVIVQLAQAGRLQGRVAEDQLKMLLDKFSEKREIKIKKSVKLSEIVEAEEIGKKQK